MQTLINVLIWPFAAVVRFVIWVVPLLYRGLVWCARVYLRTWRSTTENGRVIMTVITTAASCSVFLMVISALQSHSAPPPATPAPTARQVAIAASATRRPSATPRPSETATPSTTPTASDTPGPSPTPTVTLTPSLTSTPRPTDTPRPTNTPRPTRAPIDLLGDAVRNKLGTCNRGVPKVSDLWLEEGYMFVTFAVDDSLVESWIAVGAKDDIADILRVISQSSIDYEFVNVKGTFSMRDKLGNVSESVVINATYYRTTVDKINWSGFRSDDVLDIADELNYVHPQLQ